jgi:RHS repeat-associated protein
MKSRWIFGLIVSLASVHAANAQNSFGRTLGHFAVSSTGSGQYTIPFPIPRGPGGVQPNISLRYDSQLGDGIVGPGWTLSGLGAITRCVKTYAQDTVAAPVALSTADGYCLNGNRLRLTSGTYGVTGSTYQTEIADFSNITAYGTAGNGPQYFIAQTKDGLYYEFGNSASSRITASGATTPYQWLVSKVRDHAGNNYIVNYGTSQTGSSGIGVPLGISYAPMSLGSSSYAYSVSFGYGGRGATDSISKYSAGYSTVNTNQLTGIVLAYNNNIIKIFNLTYQLSPTTARNRLTQVQECAATTMDCLSPTTITYQDGQKGTATTSSTALSSAPGANAMYDFNGDGRTDIAYVSGTVLYVAMSTGSGYATPISTGASAVVAFGDVLGQGLTGILANNGGTLWYYTYNGTGFTGQTTGVPFDSTAVQYLLVDLDGNGRPALVALYRTTITSRVNTSSATTPSFAATATTIGTVPLTNQGAVLLDNSGLQAGKLRFLDFNGDGRQDLVLQTDQNVTTGGMDHDTYTNYELISNGSSATLTSVMLPSGRDASNIFFLNWNDDSCTDAVFNKVVYISGCNGSLPTTFVLPAPAVAALDWNGDGRTDLLVANGTTLGVYLSTGTGIAGTMLTTSVPYSSAGQYFQFDIDGDGLDDLGYKSATSPYPITYYPHNSAGIYPDLAIGFTDGYGVTFEPSYASLAASVGVYTKGGSQTYPQQDYNGPLYVTKSALASDGIGSTYTQTYFYTGAVVNVQGRGFQGFTSLQDTDGRTNLVDTKTYSTGFLSGGIVVPTAGMLVEESVKQSAGTSVSDAQSTLAVLTLSGTANSQRYFPYVSSSNFYQYEVQIGGSYNGQAITNIATNYGTPDSYGNFSNIVTTVTDIDTGSPYYNQQWTTTVATTYAEDAGPNWCLNMPTERDVTKTSPGSTITRHVGYTPDYANCRETQQVVESGNANYQVTIGYGYDSFGNVNSRTVTGIGMAARTTGVNWGTNGQFPTIATNALNQQTQLSFDPNTGLLSSQTDPNGIVTSWQYDLYGRKIKESRPDGTSTTWAYNNCASAGCVNSNNKMTVVQTNVNVGGSTLNIQNTYLDAFDRVLVTSKQMMNGAYDRNEVQYDNMGNVHQQSAPCTFISCATYWTTNTYDLLNRLTQSQRPISASNGTLQTTTIQYAGRTTTTTDPQSKVTTQITKVTGAVGRTKDHNGYFVNFNHDAFGALLSVTDSLSNTLRTMTYDYGLQAFQRTLTDIDLGSRSYTVDALGEVTAYSDGKGQNFLATFDPLSRPTSRTEPDLSTTWTWGSTAASFNIGKLASVSSVSSVGTHSDSFTYDSAGRMTDHTIVNPTDGSRSFDFAYNATTGLPSTLTYPTSASPATYRLMAGYTYQYGILQQIFDSATPTTIWWAANATNPRGQITQETTEDLAGHPQIVSTRVFDADTGWLTSTQSGVGGGSTLQNEAYLYDEIGNVTQRQNNNLGLTENFYYDNLYRLDHSTLGAVTNLQMAYDAMGDITSRSDVAGGATWTYDPTRKHAVTQAGSSSFTYAYDANGNVSSRNGSIITWTSYNYPNGVTTSSESATFDYGPDRQRWRMVYTDPSGNNETTYYATQMFETVYSSAGADFRHYIYAGNRPVVVISRTSAGAINVRSLLVDRQGSISTIVTDSTGVADVSESFTAYGNRREANTWTGAPTSTELNTMNGVTREGYTFQTVLGSMSLNHMNGRIEDSVTGRFLSPDSQGTIRGNTQSWNRFSYVINNPVTLADPTGFNPDDGPQYADHAHGGGFGEANIGSFGWFFANQSDSMSSLSGSGYDMAALTAWFVAAGAANAFGDGGGASAGNTGGIAASMSTSGVAQSQDASQSGCVGSPCLDQITVNASASYPSTFGKTIPGNFTCGSFSCSYVMSAFQANTLIPTVGARLLVKTNAAGGAWVQTRFDYPTGQFVPDPSGFYPFSDDTTPTQFYDQPGMQSPGIWVGQTSFLVRNPSGGYTVAFTMMWGFSYAGGGLIGVIPNPPVIAGPWSSQQQAIGSVQ